MKRRGVILEGPDNSGKSSFIKRLKLAFPGGWDVLQMAHQPGDQFTRYIKVYLEAERLLLDRAHFSERVYGDLFRQSKHFAPWELEILNRIAREEFVTILCTAPADVLVERYAARAIPQPLTTADDTIAARARFHEVVEPHATLVFDTDFSIGIDAMERKLAAAIVQIGTLVDTGRTAAAGDAPRACDLIVVEGTADSGRSDVARLLSASLPGWCVARFDATDRDPCRHLLRQYATAQRTIVDGGYLTYLATSSLTAGENGDGTWRRTLDDYVASRALSIVCERAEPDIVSRRIRAMAEQSGARQRVVRTDDPHSLEALTTSVRRAIDRTAERSPDAISVPASGR
jgi:thymidylate kinase